MGQVTEYQPDVAKAAGESRVDKNKMDRRLKKYFPKTAGSSSAT
jgi:hypothetical protein